MARGTTSSFYPDTNYTHPLHPPFNPLLKTKQEKNTLNRDLGPFFYDNLSHITKMYVACSAKTDKSEHLTTPKPSPPLSPRPLFPSPFTLVTPRVYFPAMSDMSSPPFPSLPPPSNILNIVVYFGRPSRL